MKRFLLALLKLLLQLVILVLTGKWMRIGEPSSSPARSRQARQRPVAGERRKRHGGATPPSSTGRSLEPSSREGGWLERGGQPRVSRRKLFEALPPPERWGPEGGEPVRKRKRERKTGPISQAPVLPITNEGPAVRSLASALRDPRALKEAWVLGAALSPRRPRR